MFAFVYVSCYNRYYIIEKGVYIYEKISKYHNRFRWN